MEREPAGSMEDMTPTPDEPLIRLVKKKEPAPGNNTSKRMWRVLLILLLLIILNLFGWWWIQTQKAKKQNEPVAKTTSPASQAAKSEDARGGTGDTATPCADSLVYHENKSLGLAFCYPKAWGTVAAEDAKFAAADAGSRWRIGFSAKEAVHLGAVSADWSTSVPRDGTCVDPAVQALPPFAPFSTTWQTTGTPVSSATRGIEVLADQYLLQERVDDLLTNGACLEGYRIINGTYPHAAATYSAEFGGAVTTPDQHVTNPTVLIPATDRSDFGAFVKSVRKL
ncbi:MAG TPA: hypothetical protein VJ836_02060 [Candidatus Saccharimonadales bacterium]|nr:hypothetical protein [Candidatus Saccharimonadales bacterium]